MLDKPVKLYPTIGTDQSQPGQTKIFGNGDVEPTIPVMAGIGSRVMQRFQSPALSSYRMVQVGAGAATYGAVTLNLGSTSNKDVKVANLEDDFNQISDYFYGPKFPDYWIKDPNAPVIVKEGEPLILNPTGDGRSGLTTTVAGRTQLDEGFYIEMITTIARSSFTQY